MAELKEKLGLEVTLEGVLKPKGNQRELQVVKEHKEAIEKTDLYAKQNKEIEKKVEGMA